MDPNDDEQISVQRDAAWVMAKVGNGTSTSFQKYCGSNGWLGWVYLKDEESGFLLASASDPNVPMRFKMSLVLRQMRTQV
jgi:hypothetical protein